MIWSFWHFLSVQKVKRETGEIPVRLRRCNDGQSFRVERQPLSDWEGENGE